MKPCEWCGNDMPERDFRCPHCDRTQSAADAVPKKPSKYRTANIKHGQPTVAEALARLASDIANARADGVKILTVIHGYGSTGRGGDIRLQARSALARMQKARRIDSFIAGEDFKNTSETTRGLLARFPKMREDRYLDQGNEGITLVVL